VIALARSFALSRVRVLALMLVGTVAALTMVAVASASTDSTTISSQLTAVISLLTTNGTVNVNVLPSSSGAQTIQSDTVTVSTNDTAGYTLQLGETGAGSTLVSGSNTIPAS